MSLPSELLPVGLLGTGAAAEVYSIERSVRFNSADSAYLSRTPASAGNRKTWTWAGWVKKVKVSPSDESCLFGDTNESYDCLRFRTTDVFEIFWYDGGNKSKRTTAVFRDVSAWYHIVVKSDTTQASEPDRVKLYINGIEQTAFATNDSIAQDYEWRFNNNTAISIGRRGTSGSAADYLDGYLADIHFIDGQALDPTSFGEFDTNNVWQPKAFSGGSYGTNGFHLDFADNSSAAALGYDAAGSNDWTVNNLSVTAGAGNDSLRDSPTNGTQTDTGAGGEVVGNYCTLNPLDSTGTLTNGNLDWLNGQNRSTIQVPTSGKWYVEQTFATLGTFFWGADIGLRNYDSSRYAGLRAAAAKAFQNLGTGNTPTHSQCAPGDIIGIAINSDNGSITFYKNNTNVWQITNIADISNLFFWCSTDSSGDSGSWNFGQRPFAYTAPSGFKALCTANLPAPTIEDGSTAMDVVTYTGNGSTQTISGLEFSPDFVWVKNRSTNNGSRIADTVRGVTKFLISNNANAEDTNAQALQSFTADGFTVGSNQGYNTNSDSYVAWNWDGGSSTVTNTDGSITSTVRANASAGISIISYTGNGTSGATVGHGLNVAPSFYICKFRNTNASNGPWYVYHKSLGATKGLTLNTTDAESTLSSLWNDTEPTSTVFSLGNAGDTNGSGRNFISYAFAPVSGFSAFGSYIGNGNADGPFVYTGFRPAFVLVKMSSSTGDWTILDSIREGYNVDNDPLYANLNNAEGTADLVDITSNGFKVRTTDATFNTNAGTYVYAAFAENPFQYARAR